MENTNPQPQSAPEKLTEEPPKLPYEAPRLVVHGAVEKLTLQTG